MIVDTALLAAAAATSLELVYLHLTVWEVMGKIRKLHMVVASCLLAASCGARHPMGHTANYTLLLLGTPTIAM